MNKSAQLQRESASANSKTLRKQDQLAFRRGGHDGAAEETKGFLGGMAPVCFLPHGHGGDVPYGGELGGGVGAVYEVVIEGVPGLLAPARPEQRLM